MSGPQNILMDDGFDIPMTVQEIQNLNKEKNMARFSKTKEFKDLKNYIESRITFYQQYLPDGRPVVTHDNMVERGQNWVVANAIIGELKAIITSYELATEAVKNAQ